VPRLQETRYGCCDDGHTIAEGPRGEGCPSSSRLCRESQHGCCPDGVTSAIGKQFSRLILFQFAHCTITGGKVRKPWRAEEPLCRKLIIGSSYLTDKDREISSVTGPRHSWIVIQG